MSAEVEKGPWFGVRHLQALLIFLDVVAVYFSRLHVAVSVVAMTNAATSNPDFPEFAWNEKHKSYILSCFYWGNLVMQFPAGFLARRYGCKKVMFTSTFATGVFTLAVPFCVPWGGWQVFCLLRILQGLFQGVTFPSIQQHLAKWAPQAERNRLGALSFTGVDCGTLLSMGISGVIAEGPLGWPGISYVSAGLCFAWCFLWLLLGANNAPASRLCTPAEREYIETSLRRAEGFHQRKIPIPWRAIATSTPFHALIVVSLAKGWGFTTVQSQLPSYVNGVLKLNIKSNALFSALPYLAMWLTSYVFLIVADVAMQRQWFTLTVLRKTFNTLAFWVPAACLIGVGFLDEEQKVLAFVLMTLNVGINSGVTIGSYLNSIDLSSNHAGILNGTINFFTNVTVLFTPLLVGVIVTDESNRTQWQIVFLIAALVFFFGNLVYLIWGATEQQPWNAVDFLVLKEQEKRAQERSASVGHMKSLNEPSALELFSMELNQKEL